LNSRRGIVWAARFGLPASRIRSPLVEVGAALAKALLAEVVGRALLRQEPQVRKNMGGSLGAGRAQQDAEPVAGKVPQLQLVLVPAHVEDLHRRKFEPR
jgi:hypothetical protein